MAYYSFVSVATMCLCLSMAAGVDVSSPVKETSKVMEGVVSSLTCSKMCNLGCKLNAAVCIKINGVLDCAKKTLECSSDCSKLCKCPDSCIPDCNEKHNCTAETGISSVVCLSQKNLCVADCGALCTVPTSIQGERIAMREGMDMAQKLMEQVHKFFSFN